MGMKMTKTISVLIIAVFLSGLSVRGQSLERTAISSAGGSYYDGVNFEVDYSLGEFAIMTLNNTNNNLTQGFMQPFVDIGVNIMENLDNGITISYYPNPTSNNLTLNISNSENREFNIGLYDLLGQCLIQKTIVSKFDGVSNLEIDMKNLAVGNYYIRIISGNDFTKSFKVLKINN
jgi:hypothetical protein